MFTRLKRVIVPSARQCLQQSYHRVEVRAHVGADIRKLHQHREPFIPLPSLDKAAEIRFTTNPNSNPTPNPDHLNMLLRMIL